MLNERSGLIKRIINYWLGPGRPTKVFVESETQLVEKKPISPFELGASVAARLEELKKQLNQSSNTFQ